MGDDTIYYVGDPMCSWCWGFAPVLQGVKDVIPAEIPLVYVMGGLAKDSDEPMPQETREYIKGQWHLVTEQTGASFNWDFWEKCEPRRSTYPACRAAICAGLQQPDSVAGMFEAIQHAYYQEARNPSDFDTLTELAGEQSLDVARFAKDLVSDEAERALQEGFNVRRSLGVREFPSLVYKRGEDQTWLVKGWANKEDVFQKIEEAGIVVAA
jgi:putative protein-disulfide isomerase